MGALELRSTMMSARGSIRAGGFNSMRDWNYPRAYERHMRDRSRRRRSNGLVTDALSVTSIGSPTAAQRPYASKGNVRRSFECGCDPGA
jgi:hypothetical protein